MKNLFLTTALLLALTANAFDLNSSTNGVVVCKDQEKEFKKVETTQIPAEILKQASNKYSGYSLKGAQASDDGEYRLVLYKDGKSVTAHYKSNGEFVKEAQA